MFELMQQSGLSIVTWAWMSYGRVLVLFASYAVLLAFGIDFFGHAGPLEPFAP